MYELLNQLLTFSIIAIAAQTIGQWGTRLGLPKITGYLFVGAIAGPFALALLPEEAIENLHFLDEIALGIIAFIAGSEMNIGQLRARFATIRMIVLWVIVLTLPVGTAALFILTRYIPSMTALSTIDRVAVALLGGTILLALSPPSTIAIIKEVKARGAFTSTVLGVTVAMDIVIIVLFAVAIRIAAAILTGAEISIVFAVVLLINLILTLVVGVMVGMVIREVGIFQRHGLLQMALIICLSYGIFAGTRFAATLTHGRGLELHVEPLLIALTAGVYVVNYTEFGRQFDTLLHRLSPPTYIIFFTLTGLMIKLNVLIAMLPIALVLFAVRFVTINVGSYVGSRLTNQSQLTARYAGLALITQAGIALGLARNVANTLPMLGDTFTTMVVAVIILNELFGPLFLKLALRKVGESHSAEIAPSHTISAIRTPDSANVV